MAVDLTDDFFGVPRGIHFTSRVTGCEQTQQLGAARLGETLIGFGQQPSDPIQRVVFASPVSDGFVLDAATAPIEKDSDCRPPSRQNKVSSNTSAVTSPIRS